jgi:hypothetical protein
MNLLFGKMIERVNDIVAPVGLQVQVDHQCHTFLSFLLLSLSQPVLHAWAISSVATVHLPAPFACNYPGNHSA